MIWYKYVYKAIYILLKSEKNMFSKMLEPTMIAILKKYISSYYGKNIYWKIFDNVWLWVKKYFYNICFKPLYLIYI